MNVLTDRVDVIILILILVEGLLVGAFSPDRVDVIILILILEGLLLC